MVAGMPWKGPCPGPVLQPGMFPPEQSTSWWARSPEVRGSAERRVLAGQCGVAADPLSLSLQLNCSMQNLSVKNSNSSQ